MTHVRFAQVKQYSMRLIRSWQVWVVLWVVINALLFFSPGTGDTHMYQDLMGGFRTYNADHFTGCFAYDMKACPGHSSNYPPLYLTIFFLFSRLFPADASTFIMVKLFLLVFSALTLITIAVFAYYLNPLRQKKQSVYRAIVLYVTSFALIANTQGLGYIDILVFPFLILCVFWYIKGRFYLFGIFFALSFLVKWQPIILLPYILVWVGKHENMQRLIQFILGMSMVVVVVAVSMGAHGPEQLVKSIQSATHNEFFSAAPNVPMLAQIFFPFGVRPAFFSSLASKGLVTLDTHAPHWLIVVATGFKLVFYIYYIAIIFQLIRHMKDHAKRVDILGGLAFISLGYFFLATGVHENHLMLGVILFMLLALVRGTKEYVHRYRIVDGISMVSMVVYFVSFERWIIQLPIIFFIAVLCSLWFIRYIQLVCKKQVSI